MRGPVSYFVSVNQPPVRNWRKNAVTDPFTALLNVLLSSHDHPCQLGTQGCYCKVTHSEHHTTVLPTPWRGRVCATRERALPQAQPQPHTVRPAGGLCGWPRTRATARVLPPTQPLRRVMTYDRTAHPGRAEVRKDYKPPPSTFLKAETVSLEHQLEKCWTVAILRACMLTRLSLPRQPR